MALTPSPSRRLIVPRRDATPRGYTRAPLLLRWPDKEPGSVLDYSLDIAQLLDAGDSVSAFTAATLPSVPGGLVVDSTIASGTIGTAWLGDGADGVDYQVQMAFSSLAGRHLDVTVWLRVASLTSI